METAFSVWGGARSRAAHSSNSKDIDAQVPTALLDVATAAAAAFSITRSPLVAVTYAASTAVAMTAAGLYRPRLRYPIFAALLTVMAAVAVAALATRTLLPSDLSMVVASVVLASLVGEQVAVHVLALPLIRRRQPRRTIVVGAGHVGVTLVEALVSTRSFGLKPLGFVDDCGPDPGLPAPILGPLSSLDQQVCDNGVGDVIIAFGVSREFDLVRIVRACEQENVRVWLVPRLFELSVPAGADRIRGVPLVPISRSRLNSRARLAKRAFDIVVSSMLLLLASPAMVVIAALVKGSSVGPILFRQERVGQFGRTFSILKFRTMRVNDDSPRTWSVRQDDRVTSIGRLLRRTSLDELPQLLNVLRGDLSIVGPRPERPHFAQIFGAAVPRYSDRVRMPMGMTGLAQINGLRGDTSISERVFLDNQYIDNWSICGDIRILVQTTVALLRPPERGEPDGAEGFGPLRQEPRRCVDVATQGTAVVHRRADTHAMGGFL